MGKRHLKGTERQTNQWVTYFTLVGNACYKYHLARWGGDYLHSKTSSFCMLFWPNGTV